MFTEPPLARVGLSEREARQQGVSARVARLPMTGVRRTATTDETQGFMKVLVGERDDRILGFTMIGAEAGEVIRRPPPEPPHARTQPGLVSKMRLSTR